MSYSTFAVRDCSITAPLSLASVLGLVSSFLSAKNKTQLNSLFKEDGLKIIQYVGVT